MNITITHYANVKITKKKTDKIYNKHFFYKKKKKEKNV